MGRDGLLRDAVWPLQRDQCGCATCCRARVASQRASAICCALGTPEGRRGDRSRDTPTRAALDCALFQPTQTPTMTEVQTSARTANSHCVQTPKKAPRWGGSGWNRGSFTLRLTQTKSARQPVPCLLPLLGPGDKFLWEMAIPGKNTKQNPQRSSCVRRSGPRGSAASPPPNTRLVLARLAAAIAPKNKPR